MSIQLPPNSTGTVVDTVTLAAKDREIIIVGGDTAAAEVAAVKNTAPARAAYRMATATYPWRDFDPALTTAALGISGNFTSSWFSTEEGGETYVTVSARANVASATDGFVIEESSSTGDSNFTRTVASVSVSADTTTYLRVAIREGNWRVNYTNGGTGQATFRIAYAVSPQPIEHFLDFDTGTGVIPVQIMGIALPGSGGPVAGGTNTNPVQVGDAGGTLTVDNAALSVTGGGVEASALRVTVANDSTGLLSVDDNAGSLTVDNAALSVTGGGVEATALRVTLANDSTGLVSVDDNGGNLSVDWAGTVPPIGAGTEAAALRVTLATDSTGLISVDDNAGSLTVDVGTALPAGSNNIGDVDVLSVVPGTGATNLGKAEDGASADGDVGVGMLAVRKATPANTSGLDGDYEFVQMSAGRVWTSATIDAAIPAGTNNIGDVDVLTLPALVAGTANIGDVDVLTLPALVAGTANIGDVDVLTVPAPLSTTGGGTEAAALRVTIANDSTGLVSIDDNAGSLTVDQATASNLKTEPAGQVAHDAVDSSNPLKIGAKAKTTLEAVTAVAADDRTDLYADLNGRLIVAPMCPAGDLISERVSNTDGASTAFATFGAGGAGIRNYVTAITVHNAHATTNGFVDIRDGTAGSVLWTIPAPATGGAVIAFNPPLRQTTANTALAYDASAAITTVYISVNGFQSNV